MTADVLTGQRQIAMALLKPGWEKSYYDRPEIEPIVCVGTILTYELLDDGKYNFLLQGHTRARIVREHNHSPYRLAKLDPMEESDLDASASQAFRQKIIEIFDAGSLLTTVIGRQFRQLLASDLPTPAIADLIAFNFIEDVSLKQSLLSEPDVEQRILRTIDAFERLAPAVRPHGPARPSMN